MVNLIDYPKCSSEILNIDIDSKTFDINYIYRIFGNQAFNNKLALGDENKSIRGDIYLELLIPSNIPNNVNVYNNFSLKNEINTVVGTDLYIIDPNISINDKRVWVMDRQIQLTTEPPSGIPSYISVPFNNNKYLTTKLKWTATTTNSSGIPYNEIPVQRKTIFVYYPSTTIFLLVNHNINGQIKIYVMQSINNQNDLNINILNAQYLSTKLILPSGWIFSTMNLDKDTYLKVISTDVAFLVSDSLGNSYQYLEPKYCSWIYELYPVPL